MSSLQRMLAALAISAVAAGIGVGCAPGSAADDAPASADVDVAGDAPIGESQSRQGRYGGGGGGYYDDCYGLEDGTYCGGDRLRGDPDTLYECVNGRKYFRQYCGAVYRGYGGRYGGGGGYSCVRMPPGVPDYCG